MERSKITTNNMNTYMRLHGKKAEKVIEILARNAAFMDAIDSALGRELLKDVLDRMESKVNLIFDEKDTPKDRAEFRAYKAIVSDWTKRINETRSASQTYKESKEN